MTRHCERSDARQSSIFIRSLDCRVASLLAITKNSHYLRRMHLDDEYKRLHWRAHHRGTREADRMIGGFFDAYGNSWSSGQRALFDAMLEEQDVDIMAWAIGTAEPPERYRELMPSLQRLDYLPIAR